MMVLENNYWYFDSVVQHDVCDKIMELGLASIKQSATVNGFNDQVVKQVRDSSVAWIDQKWIYQLLQTFVDIANVEAGWNFEWDWTETCQFTEYTPGQHYQWHPDQNAKPHGPESNPGFVGKYRKLSVSLSLTDHREYIGGDLQFDYGGGDIRTCYEIKPRGSVVVFPSFIRHRVTPVYKGTRHSLVMWNLGKPYK